METLLWRRPATFALRLHRVLDEATRISTYQWLIQFIDLPTLYMHSYCTCHIDTISDVAFKSTTKVLRRTVGYGRCMAHTLNFGRDLENPTDRFSSQRGARLRHAGPMTRCKHGPKSKTVEEGSPASGPCYSGDDHQS